MNVLIFGRGVIGTEFAKQFRSIGYRVTTLTHCTDDEMRKAMNGMNLVVNAAGYTGEVNVDDCAKFRGRTLESNVVLPVRIKEACRRYAVPWIHVSSGCIYDGYPKKPFTEKSKPNFTFDDATCSFYSGSKALAEQMVVNSMCWTCRIRMPFWEGISPKNYIYKILNYPILMSLTNSLSNLHESVGAMIILFQKGAPYGIYNIVNSGTLTAVEGLDIASEFVERDSKYPVVAWPSFYKPLMEERRSNTILSNEKLAKEGIPMSDVKESFKSMCKIYAKALCLE